MDILAFMKQNQLPEKYQQMTKEALEARAQAVKTYFGEKLFILGHHYQRDEVFQFADVSGDSLQLSQVAARQKAADYIVFCGVHFMAETADVLSSDHQQVILPDLRAGCPMADMADIHQAERAWVQLQDTFGDTITPLTYVNSTAAIKAFCGRNEGATVTSTNAKKVLTWAFTRKERILFLPDQHLGRNTAYDLGILLSEMAVWDPEKEALIYEGDVAKIKVILWKGHCSVHQNFTTANIEQIRKADPEMRILVHPECCREVVELADDNGSTHYIIQTIEQAPAGSKWAIGTEMNLVKRLIANHPNKEIISLNPYFCACLTMNRIDLPHLVWALDELAKGNVINRITVAKAVADEAKLALDRMLRLS
ncbi:MAG: quinolinate synthase NadA [Defluviitaleaceae bacterium]|nr:quinolinate synthase NadA [Defluviitaleaceae bacterium]